MKFVVDAYPEANKSFRKPSGVRSWLLAERENWKWLNEDPTRQPSPIWQKVDKALGGPLSNLNNAIEGKDEKSSLEWANHALDSLSRLANNQGYLPSRSSLAKYISELREQDWELSAAMAEVAMTARTTQIGNTRLKHEAVASIRIFELGATSATATSAARQVNKIKGEFGRFVDESEAQTEDLIETIVRTTKNKETAYKRSKTTLARWIKRQRSKIKAEELAALNASKESIEESITDAKGKVDAFVDYYENKIALQEPAAYWDTKRKSHRQATVWLGVLFVCYSFALFKLVRAAFQSIEMTLSDSIEFLTDLSLGSVAAVLVVIGIALIGSRILYRLFLSQLHLWNDASERVTMIKTYLALAKRDHAKEEHLVALTNRLFAPATDGMVKDDFGSLSVFESVANKFK